MPLGGCKTGSGEGWGIGGKIKWRLCEVNARRISRGQDELVGKFKMVAGDMVSIRGQVMEYTYIPTGMKRVLVRSGVDCDWSDSLVTPSL